MARLHVMTGNGDSNTFHVVCHAPVPAGNNSAGVSWKTAVTNAFKPKTVMAIGVTAGQISQSEADQVASGDVLEVQFDFTDNPAWTSQERTAQLNAIAADAVTRTQNEYAAKLKWFGATVT